MLHLLVVLKQHDTSYVIPLKILPKYHLNLVGNRHLLFLRMPICKVL